MWPLIIPLIIMLFVPTFWVAYDVPREYRKAEVTNRDVMSFIQYAYAVSKKTAAAPNDFNEWSVAELAEVGGESFLLGIDVNRINNGVGCLWQNFYHAGSKLRFAYGVPRSRTSMDDIFSVEDPQFFGYVRNGAFVGRLPSQETDSRTGLPVVTWTTLNPASLGIPEGAFVFAIRQNSQNIAGGP